MANQNQFAYSSLAWVKKDLDHTLEGARQAIMSYLELNSPENLRHAIELTREALGTLEVVGVPGATLLTQECLLVLEGIVQGQVRHPEEAVQPVIKGLLQLPDYLEFVQQEKVDLPIILVATINDLRASRDEPLLSDNLLSIPRLSTEQEKLAITRQPHSGEDAQKLARALRHIFQLGLLGWYRNQSIDDSLLKMAAVCKRLRDCSRTLSGRRLWWLSQGLAEALYGRYLESSPAVRALMGRIDRQIRLLVERGEVMHSREVPADLIRNLLFYIGASRSGNPTVNGIKELYFPRDEEKDHRLLAAAQMSVSGTNNHLFNSVASAIGEDIAQLKDQLEVYENKAGRKRLDLPSLVANITQLGDTLSMLGLRGASVRMANQRNALTILEESQGELDSEGLAALAEDLVTVEGAVARFRDDGRNQIAHADADDRSDDLARERDANYLRVRHSVASEILADLSHCKLLIEERIGEGAPASAYRDLVPSLFAIEGASEFIEAVPLQALVARFRILLTDGMSKESEVLTPDVDDVMRMADVVASAEVFLDSVRSTRNTFEHLLRPGERALQVLAATWGHGDAAHRVTDDSGLGIAASAAAIAPRLLETDFASGSLSAEELVAEELVAEELVAEELVAEELVAEELVAEELVAEELVAEELVAEELVAEELVAEELVAEELVAEELVAELLPFETYHSGANNAEDVQPTSEIALATWGEEAFELSKPSDLVVAQSDQDDPDDLVGEEDLARQGFDLELAENDDFDLKAIELLVEADESEVVGPDDELNDDLDFGLLSLNPGTAGAVAATLGLAAAAGISDEAAGADDRVLSMFQPATQLMADPEDDGWHLELSDFELDDLEPKNDGLDGAALPPAPAEAGSKPAKGLFDPTTSFSASPFALPKIEQNDRDDRFYMSPDETAQIAIKLSGDILDEAPSLELPTPRFSSGEPGSVVKCEPAADGDDQNVSLSDFDEFDLDSFELDLGDELEERVAAEAEPLSADRVLGDAEEFVELSEDDSQGLTQAISVDESVMINAGLMKWPKNDAMRALDDLPQEDVAVKAGERRDDSGFDLLDEEVSIPMPPDQVHSASTAPSLDSRAENSFESNLELGDLIAPDLTLTDGGEDDNFSEDEFVQEIRFDAIKLGASDSEPLDFQGVAGVEVNEIRSLESEDTPSYILSDLAAGLTNELEEELPQENLVEELHIPEGEAWQLPESEVLETPNFVAAPQDSSSALFGDESAALQESLSPVEPVDEEGPISEFNLRTEFADLGEQPFDGRLAQAEAIFNAADQDATVSGVHFDDDIASDDVNIRVEDVNLANSDLPLGWIGDEPRPFSESIEAVGGETEAFDDGELSVGGSEGFRSGQSKDEGVDVVPQPVMTGPSAFEGLAVFPEEVDEEIYEIFVEELEEENEHVWNAIPRWQDAPDNHELVSQIRRSWHTLKGSGRLVGAEVIGEYAWAHEQLLNRILENGREADSAAIEAIQDGASLLPGLIAQLRTGEMPSLDVEAQMRHVQTLVMQKTSEPVDEFEDTTASEFSLDELNGAPLDSPDGAAGNVFASGELLEPFEASFDFESNDEEDLLGELASTSVVSMAPDVLDDDALDSLLPESSTLGLSDESIDSFEPLLDEREVNEGEQPNPVLSDFDEELTHLDPVLIQIFNAECVQHLDTVSAFVDRFRAQADRGPMLPAIDLIRSIHTINGSARTADIPEIYNVSASLERYLDKLVSAPAEQSADLPFVLQDYSQHVQAVLDGLINDSELQDGGMIEALINRKSALLDEQIAGISIAEAGSRSSGVAPDLPGDQDAELVEVFLEECREILDNCEIAMSRWQHQLADLGALSELRRELHTLKGGARMAGFRNLGNLSHSVENLLAVAVDGQRDMDDSFLTGVHAGFDQIHRMIEDARSHRPIYAADAVMAALKKLRDGAALTIEDKKVLKLQSGEPSAANADATDDGNTDSAFGDIDRVDEHADDIRFNEPSAPSSQLESVRVKSEMLDRLVNNVGEVNVYQSRVEQQLSSVSFNLQELQQTISRLAEQLRRMEMETEAQILFRHEHGGPGNLESTAMQEMFDPLELDRYSNIQQLSRSLKESVSDLQSIHHLLDDQMGTVEGLLQSQSRISNELQEGLMHTRMLQFSLLIPRLRRVVRQTAMELDKDVNVEFRGENNEIDRKVLDSMIVPLEHMLRNAVAHGIERPEVRQAAGKSRTGEITVSISREGPEILISISDDGAGINSKAVRARGLERGLIEKSQQLTDNEVMSLIMEPGFTTVDEVSQIAGRGVGMDVVSTQVKQLNGTIEIVSRSGQGAQFRIHLPFTLAITQALLVQSRGNLYAVPLNSIEGVIQLPARTVHEQFGSEAPKVEYAGETYELKQLAAIMERSGVQLEQSDKPLPILLAQVASRRMAFQVDTLLGNREVVVKSVGALLDKVLGVSGATILGDGRVVIILDIGGLVRARRTQEKAEPATTAVVAPEKKSVPVVMVVDDSITIRKVTARMLERNKYKVVTAKDGIDAIEQLQSTVPDVMLLDIEMPRMDGFELAAHIRNTPAYRGVPIIMITSRTGKKHKDKAISLGVNTFLGKPYQENILLEHIQTLLKSEESGDERSVH